MAGEPARSHARAQQLEVTSAKARPPQAAPVHALAAMQTAAGNRAVARLVQRKDLGKGTGGKTWASTGNFDGKHLIEAAPDNDTAKAKYTARYNKGANIPDGNQVNTVVGEADLKAAIIDSKKVTGSYPAARGPRGKLTIAVAGKKVFGKKTAGKQVPDRVSDVASLTVEGTSTESLYMPDHVAG